MRPGTVRRLGASLCSAALLQGCAYLSALERSLSVDAPSAHRFAFADGGEALYYTLDKGAAASPRRTAPRTHVFVIAGSGCTSMKYFLPHYFRGLEGDQEPVRIWLLQKRFIGEHTWGRMFGCGDDFVRADHPSRWIADQVEFIRSRLAQVPSPEQPLHVAVVGISEGGEAVPAIARQIPQVTHVALLANGGMNPFDAFRLQSERTGSDVAYRQIAVVLSEAPAKSADELLIQGRTLRYWRELQQTDHEANLIALEKPIFIAMGDRDEMVPVESARYIEDRFRSHGKNNLTVRIYPDADHKLDSPAGSYLPDFWHKFELWLNAD